MPHIPAYAGGEPYIFVSYAHADEESVMQEVYWLNQNGFNVWYDEGISGGSQWREEIAQAIKNASQVIFFVTENSISSSVCVKEVSYALLEDRNVLPIYLSAVELPEGLKLSLSDIQALFKFDDSEELYRSRLNRALAKTIKLSTPRETTIAVLPFTNLTQEKKLEDFFSYGIAEEIINGLVQSKRVKVTPRNTTFKYDLETDNLADIGRTLNATHIIEGSVRNTSSGIRVSVQLITVDDVSVLWSGSLDRELTDILQVQDEITREILLNLFPEPETVDRQVEIGAQNLNIDAPQDSSIEQTDNSVYTILVVDDEELNHDMLSRRLKRKGYQVLLASAGYSALGIVEMEKVDLVLLDIMMPGVDGFQVLQGLRERRTESQLPIIMVSALTDSEVMVKALSAGANDYVTKPLDFPVVLARIETQLRKTSLDRKPVPSDRLTVQTATNPGQNATGKSSEKTWESAAVASRDELLSPGHSSAEPTTGATIDGKPRILLVEDNELNRDMLTRRLTRRGYNVITANDGIEAIATTRKEQPDLVLMDMRMPVMAGWEATRSLKADPNTAHIPIIALTAHTMDSDEQKAREAGCDDFETKPVVLHRLLDKIVGLLARHKN